MSYPPTFRVYGNNTVTVSDISTIDNIHTKLESISLQMSTQEKLHGTITHIKSLIENDSNSPQIVQASSIKLFDISNTTIPATIHSLEGMRESMFDIERRFLELFGKRNDTGLLKKIDNIYPESGPITYSNYSHIQILPYPTLTGNQFTGYNFSGDGTENLIIFIGTALVTIEISEICDTVQQAASVLNGLLGIYGTVSHDYTNLIITSASLNNPGGGVGEVSFQQISGNNALALFGNNPIQGTLLPSYHSAMKYTGMSYKKSTIHKPVSFFTNDAEEEMINSENEWVLKPVTLTSGNSYNISLIEKIIRASTELESINNTNFVQNTPVVDNIFAAFNTVAYLIDGDQLSSNFKEINDIYDRLITLSTLLVNIKLRLEEITDTRGVY